MRFLFALLLTVLLTGLVSYFLPWWTIAPAAAIIAFLLELRPGRAFGVGFLAVFLLWLGFYLFRDMQAGGVLSARMAGVFPLGGNRWLLMVVGAVVGGIVGGLGALTGSTLRRAIAGKTTHRHKATARHAPISSPL